MQCPTRNNFCYVCGLFAPSKNLKNITKTVVNSFQKIFKTAYVPYLWYTPEVVCDYCYRNLCKFTDGRSTIKYAVPTIWLPRTEHCNELCYFCVTFTHTKGYQYFRRNKIRYANVESVIPAVLYSPEERIAASVEIFDDVPEISEGDPTVVPTLLSTFLASNARGESPEVSEFVPTPSELGTAVPHLVTQADFNDLVRDGNLSRRTAELFASRFKQWNIVAADFKITAARDRGSTIPYDKFFKLHEDREKTWLIVMILIRCLQKSVTLIFQRSGDFSSMHRSTALKSCCFISVTNIHLFRSHMPQTSKKHTTAWN